MSIKIIGAGFPRTGTMTLKSVLEVLGYNQTYHYKDLLDHPERLYYWKTLVEHGATDFTALFSCYQATVDFPGFPHYKVLAEQYPSAKVILTTRPFEEWYQSTYSTIWQRKVDAEHTNASQSNNTTTKTLIRKQKAACVQFVRESYLHDQFDGQFDNKDYVEKIFYRHHQQVLAAIPQERLLIYEVKDGWEPLCDFLEIPVPQSAFPHLNKKEDFHAMVNKMIQATSKNLDNRIKA